MDAKMFYRCCELFFLYVLCSLPHNFCCIVDFSRFVRIGGEVLSEHEHKKPETPINFIFKLENFNTYLHAQRELTPNFEGLPFFLHKDRTKITVQCARCRFFWVCNFDKTKFIDDIFEEESFRVTIQANGVGVFRH